MLGLVLDGDHVAGLTHDRIGFVLSVGYILDSSLFLFTGWAMDVYGRKTISLPGIALLSLGMFLLQWAVSFGRLCFLSVWLGLGNGLTTGMSMHSAIRSYVGADDDSIDR